ncbi:YdcF family protein [Clostridium sp. HBUAS56010]|uniref:YdcF family protein n=1 Tax=Clostridium sp. HBUAS56010 TaxID=2571127 RepID=UPI0011780495|nr:YdcF family protein [Clostridium sp. HBUAS56010]
MWILWLIAVFCVIYYVIIVMYSGLTTSFSLVWLVLAAVCVMLRLGWDGYLKHKDRVPLWLPVSVLTVCGTGLFVFVIVEVLVFTGVAARDTSRLDYVIVLGARVKEDGISKSLKKRLDKAIDYLEDNPGTILVLSGAKGEDEPVSEAEAMRDYLVFNGVPEEQLILEMRSYSTVENIAYSRVAILEDQEARKSENQRDPVIMEPGTYELVPDKPVKIGVLTSDFHVFRAQQIAKKWGFEDIYGISSDSDPVLFVHFCIRECAAILKDKLVGNM